MGFLRTAAVVAFTAVFVALVPFYTKKSASFIFGGKVERGFENVQKVFEENFKKNWEPEGAAFAAYYKGKLVVDIWGGYADVYLRKPWANDTLTVVFSTTKVRFRFKKLNFKANIGIFLFSKRDLLRCAAEAEQMTSRGRALRWYFIEQRVRALTSDVLTFAPAQAHASSPTYYLYLWVCEETCS